MFSPEYIKELSDEAAEIAAERESKPYVPYDAKEIDSWKRFPFPNIGSYRPAGWELVDHWLVDNSGWGADYELALTPSKLRARLKEYDLKPETYGYAIIEVGQFQIVLGVFRKEDA